MKRLLFVGICAAGLAGCTAEQRTAARDAALKAGGADSISLVVGKAAEKVATGDWIGTTLYVTGVLAAAIAGAVGHRTITKKTS